MGLNAAGDAIVSCEPTVDVVGTSKRTVTSRKVHGHFVMEEPEPRTAARVLMANVWCKGGTVLHLVDSILFPDEFNVRAAETMRATATATATADRRGASLRSTAHSALS